MVHSPELNLLSTQHQVDGLMEQQIATHGKKNLFLVITYMFVFLTTSLVNNLLKKVVKLVRPYLVSFYVQPFLIESIGIEK